LSCFATPYTADDDDPIGVVERHIEVVEDASDVVWDVFEDWGRLAIRPAAFPYLAPELWRLGKYDIVVFPTSSTPLHGINSTHVSVRFFSANPVPTVVPVRGDDRGKRVRPYPMDLNRTAKESTEAASSFMRRRKCAGVGRCRVEGERRCGIGEQVIRETMVVKSVRLMRTWRVVVVLR